jgi:tetratricopeptide (TPR) repeat protein
MGAAFTGVSDDASATYWNPAGLAQLTRKELTLLQASLYADTTYGFYSYVQPSAKGGSAWGVSLTRLQNTGFERVTTTIDPMTQQFTNVESNGTFGVSEQALGFSYGRQVVENVAIGTTLQQVTRSVDYSSDSSYVADLAAMLRSKDGERRLGLTIQNVYAKVSGDTNDTYPLVLRLGLSDQFFKRRLLLDLDVEKNLNANTNMNLGGEFALTKNFKIRTGMQYQMGEGLQETDVGFGYQFKSLIFDFAMGLQSALGTSSRISATMRFGRSVLERREENVHQLVQKAFEAAQKGNFLVVQEQLQAALDADPTDKNVQQLASKFQLIVSAVPSAMGNEEVAVLTRKGVLAYANNDLKASVAALRQAYYKDPRNEKLLTMLNKLETEANMEKTEPPKGPELFSPVDQKIFDARQAILEGKYDIAIKKCQDILDLNPNDVTALKIMGSAFFLLDDHVRARKLWSRVLEIDPNDKEIPEFLKQLRPE